MLARALFAEPADPCATQITWKDEWLARLYCGRFNSHMRGHRASCMTSSEEQTRFTPYEERCFVEALFRTKPSDWEFESYAATHAPTRLGIWIARGREWCRVQYPHEIPLRVRSQRRIYNGLMRIQRERHMARHLGGVSPEARDLITKLAPPPRRELKLLEPHGATRPQLVAAE